VRRVSALLSLAAALCGCASIGAPPGGPVRTTPPELVEVTPDSGAVNVQARSVNFVFDEVISDRAELDKLILMSPQDGRPRVSWHRERIEVRPRRGFRPNTAYTVTLLPGLADLRGNSVKTGRTIVFSTGPTIPPYYVFGRVFDWMSDRTAPRALVEVVRRPDSLLYIGIADSTGQFGVGPLAEGTYTVRAIMDNNSNRGLDPGEAWDSVAVVVAGGTSPFLELLAAPRDTAPPRLLTLSTLDSTTLSANFDKPLDPGALPPLSAVRVVSSDSTPIAVLAIVTRAQADSQRAVRDSIARAARDTGARADSVRRAATAARDSARADSVARRLPTDTLRSVVAPPPPKPSRPAPPRELVLRLATAVEPAKSYRVTIANVKGLVGPARATERVITIPRARPDSTRAQPATFPRPPEEGGRRKEEGAKGKEAPTALRLSRSFLLPPRKREGGTTSPPPSSPLLPPSSND